MSCSKSLLVVLFFSIASHAAIAADPLYHFCFSEANYSNPSPYYDNLGNLLSLLSNQAPLTGFGRGSIGQDQASRVNGLALCRGDVSSSTCKSCIVDAGKELLYRCPNKKGAIIWYDYCLVKYSDTYFFGEIDYRNRFYMWNINEVQNPKEFNQKTKDLLTNLADMASASPKLYATAEREIEEATKLYGLVQCTRDLKGPGCKKCLYDAITEIPNCCDGKRGGRVVGGSCNFRYELYPFVES